jgi:phosphotriesterase-related protein
LCGIDRQEPARTTFGPRVLGRERKADAMNVPTIRGDIPVADLGFTLMHEHLVMIHPEIESNIPDIWDEGAEVARARTALAELRRLGVRTLVDLTVYGLGRNVDRIKRIAADGDVNVIVATGAYVMDELPRYFQRHGPGTQNGGPDVLEEIFVREIAEGIADTGVRPGILKCTSDVRGLTPDVERTLRATARAHRRTGVPISTHTSAADFGGLDQQRIFAEEGVDLTRVIIGHSGDVTDVGYLTRLMDAGSYIGLDRFGMDNRLSTAERCAVAAELVRRGYAPRMTLSHDASCFADSWDEAAKRRALPDWHFGFISQAIIPRLLDLGVTDGDIRQMMIMNPADIFSVQGPY